MGDIISPCCWLLFLCNSERSRLCEGTSGHTNGSRRQGTTLTASACGDRGKAILVPQRHQAHQNNLLWSWPLAHMEKGIGAGAERCGSAQGMALMKGLLEAASNNSVSPQSHSSKKHGKHWTGPHSHSARQPGWHLSHFLSQQLALDTPGENAACFKVFTVCVSYHPQTTLKP